MGDPGSYAPIGDAGSGHIFTRWHGSQGPFLETVSIILKDAAVFLCPQNGAL